MQRQPQGEPGLDQGSPREGAQDSSVRRSPEPMERALREGRWLGRVEGFEIEAEIGRGGMGAVWRARDRLLGRHVALKALGECSEAGLLRRFVVEAQLGAQLEHPNIVPFYEFLATDGGQPAFAMRLVDGQTLDAYLFECGSSPERAQSPTFDLHSRLDHFLKVCDALDYAHARGVIHRDLKPENVMLGAHHEVYVMDWGVAQVLGDATPRRLGGAPRLGPGPGSGPALTEDGEVIGTPGYLAPEQARSEPLTPAADQYALGLLLGELLTLSPLRSGSPAQQLADALIGRPPELTSRFGEPLSTELVAVIRKATAREPEQRYASVAELADDVRRYLRDEAVSVLPEPLWVALWRRAKRHPTLVIGTIATCLLLSSSLIALSLWRELGAQELAARRSERIFALTTAVDRMARGIDARFRRIELLDEGLSRAATEVLRRPAEGSTEPLSPAELGARGLPSAAPDYSQKVSFEHSVFVRSPNVPLAEVAPVLDRTADLEALLVHTAARAAAGDSALSFSDAKRRAAAREHSAVAWTDLAFERGVLLVYPGSALFPSGFETRERSWYLAARTHWGPVWGSPYPDATSGEVLLACSSAFQDAAGNFGGVAALHIRLDDVLSSLRVSAVEGYQGSFLLDESANVVLSEHTRDVKLSPGLHQNLALAPQPFAVPEVRAAIQGGAREGRLRHEHQLTVFEHLATGSWLVAVTVDAAPYGLR